MRKLGIIVLVVVVLLVAAALIIPHLIDVNHYHNQIQAQLEKRLGRQVSLGNMSLSLFPPSFVVENATIAEDPQFGSSRPFAAIDKLSVSVKFWPLLRKDLEVNSLELQRPHVELVRDAKGVWNFATLGQQGKTSPTVTTGPEGKQPAGQLTLASLSIRDGEVAITDMQKHQSR